MVVPLENEEQSDLILDMVAELGERVRIGQIGLAREDGITRCLLAGALVAPDMTGRLLMRDGSLIPIGNPLLRQIADLLMDLEDVNNLTCQNPE